MDNGYKIPHLRGRGLVCKTYLPSYTAFRGFGGPQGLTIIESVLHEVAVKCGLPTHQVGPFLKQNKLVKQSSNCVLTV